MNNIIRFDQTEFVVLNASKGGMYSPDEKFANRALLLMDEGIIKVNPIKNWPNTGWKLTPKGEKYFNQFIEAVREKHGHAWELTEDGRVDVFAYSIGYHNGMVCRKCGFSFCEHCKSEFEIGVCPNK